MEIDANVYHLLNILLQVLLWSLIISSPAIILTIEMYYYEKYKKWKNAEVREKEKIILGKAKQIADQDKTNQRLADERRVIELDIELLRKQKRRYQEELGIDDEPEETQKQPEEIQDYSKLTVKQLKAIADERGFKMYSKKKKKQLIEMLKGK